MIEADDLIVRVAARASAAAGTLPAPARAAQVEEAEALLGFALPPLLARLYTEVADGGFGPLGNELFPLAGKGRTAVSAYRAERGEPQASDSPHWPEGVLPILDWGCGMYGAVDCLSTSGTVLVFEPNADTGDPADGWFVDQPGLADWLETWLAGGGWYRPDGHDDAELPEPAGWEEAASRLAAPRVA
ncbi:SMI1/KNR4 family protein [Actinacidiphila glaucinigra]|uniref:SMI1/KNR4 family protein n=1 Tax=Actinacidiphila glaucinigra TaxID=235986 RepID=UPI002DD853C3|nr:SMI1/KNR4 family protein [Actinacidiphila glaucinigra]WSD63733.1 SMI1/KNR4 family protein [Actinacidiphila glaucinigra]